ncbi:MAG: hypothetical protein WAN64_11180, partial [Pseudolabrys sp.]
DMGRDAISTTRVMSRAGLRVALAYVRFGPKADIGCLFDHLISDLLETKRSSIGLLWRKPVRAFS